MPDDASLDDREWLSSEFDQRWQEQAAEVGRFNLAIFGKTGVGKSTLINAVFGSEVAPTGVGQPVTTEQHLYLHETGFFGLLDTRGLEVGVDTDQIIRELGHYLNQMRNKRLEDQIHVAWYCVRAADRRFEDTEGDFIRRLDELGLPVILVLTQVASRGESLHPDAIELMRHIESKDLPIAGGRVLPVMAYGDHFVDQTSHGLEALLDATFLVAPDGVEAALVAAQRVDLARKRSKANRTVLGSAAAAGALGLLSGVDRRPLALAQAAMTSKIAAIYGVDMALASMAFAAATKGVKSGSEWALAALEGRSATASDRARAVVSGLSVGGFTLAVGYAWMAVCDLLSQGKLQGADGLLNNLLVREVFLSHLRKGLTHE